MTITLTQTSFVYINKILKKYYTYGASLPYNKSTKCLCNLNLFKPNTCLNWTNFSVPKRFGLDTFYCIFSILDCIETWPSFARLGSSTNCMRKIKCTILLVYINKILKKYYTYGASLPYNKWKGNTCGMFTIHMSFSPLVNGTFTYIFYYN
jgi:hypothetical protein